MDVLLLPDMQPNFGLMYDCTAVVDVLRASTTIITAIANGAVEVIPVKSIEEALEHRAKGYLVCGERGGLKPQGFDLGNSPLEYTKERILGKKICITTSNGTRALLKAHTLSRHVYIGGFVNLSALVEKLAEFEKILILCSGNEGRVSFEDSLLAGAIVSRIASNYKTEVRAENVFLSDSALIVEKLWEKFGFPNLIGTHARKLIELGFTADVEFAKRVDYYPVVPEYSEGIVRGIFSNTLR
uniref:Probable 2-phosphosulfolactate phosphatase n=1 Tax=Fervidobacterium thailandense TaxID=1008305 RepID=A0A7C4VTJ7_9BACT